MSATTIPTDTVSDMVLNISSQNCDEFWFFPRATVLIGGWQAENSTPGVDEFPVLSIGQGSGYRSWGRLQFRCHSVSRWDRYIYIQFFTFSPAISRARSCLMSAKPNLELRKRGNMSCARKYKDCCAFISICKKAPFVVGY